MGITVELAVEAIEPDLICSICRLVLVDPVQDEHEHYFCRGCINQWLKYKPQCPLDRSPLFGNMLKPPSRLLRNLLSKHAFKCENHVYGCEKVIFYDSLRAHDKECEFKANKIIDCPNGCEARLMLYELKTHNCTRELKKGFKETIRETRVMRSQIMRLEQIKNEIQRENYLNQKNMSYVMREQTELRCQLKELEKILKPVRRILSLVESHKEKHTANSIPNTASFLDTLCAGLSDSNVHLAEEQDSCILTRTD